MDRGVAAVAVVLMWSSRSRRARYRREMELAYVLRKRAAGRRMVAGPAIDLSPIGVPVGPIGPVGPSSPQLVCSFAEMGTIVHLPNGTFQCVSNFPDDGWVWRQITIP